MLRTLRLCCLGLALSAVPACGPTVTGPVTVMVLAEADTGTYGPQPVQLQTVTDIVGLNGSVLNLIGGAKVVVDGADPLLQTPGLTDAQYKDIFLKNKGRGVHASFIDRGGVLWPAEFDTWNMVSSYYNFEQAFLYFQKVGNPALTSDLSGGNASTLYYLPVFTLVQQSPNPIVDNALFFPPVQGFMVLPFQQLQLVPLPMNAGVIAHEYSHRVFNLQVYKGEAFPQPIVTWASGGPSPALNVVKSIDEGLADWHSYGTSCASPFGCNARFLESSAGTKTADDRDFTQNNKCMTCALRTAINGLPSDQYGSQGLYQVGTVFAAALYKTGQATNQREALEKAVIASYTDSNPRTPGFREQIYPNLARQDLVSIPRLANIIVQHVTDTTLKNQLCTQFLDRLQLLASDLPDCPATAGGGTTCPNINSPPCP